MFLRLSTKRHAVDLGVVATREVRDVHRASTSGNFQFTSVHSRNRPKPRIFELVYWPFSLMKSNHRDAPIQ
eukprot:scaffold28469_cov145-Amphora_coffeaeformis.AAC.1